MNKPSGYPSKPAVSPEEDPTDDTAVSDAEEDARLVALAQGGDLKAYDELVTRHRGKIYAMIRNMVKNDADAWDLSQDAFIKAWKALPRFEGRSRFSTWLFRISHNVVYDWVRKRKIESAGELNDEIFDREKIDSSAKTAPSYIEAPDDALATSELREKIQEALDKLSPEHREAIVLKDAQGLSYKEIADVMDCTLGTVMSRLFYARQKLQTLLKDEYESR
ncbi:RNA polymerase sigma factor [Luteolibacter sp. AS25]|uniref:RNA polymerase sigma factor n=1 Tax=Luteolibacter sp. AS25 TaxID=3135776 RepID=UPI00398ACCBE